MSYILDALKKAERERPPGPVPDLFTVHGPQPPAPRRPLRTIVAAALLLAVPALALIVWIAAGGRYEKETRPPVVASPAATRPRAVVPGAVAPRSSVDGRSESRAPLTPKSQGAVASAALPAAPKPRPAAAVALAPVVPTTAPSPEVQAPAAVASETSPAGLPAAAGAPEPGPWPAPVEAPPADGRALALDELPASLRAELPKLLVSIHVWSEEPALRLLSVDDRLLHEGGAAAPGVSLQEITPTGAIFAYKGWRFRVAGGRP